MSLFFTVCNAPKVGDVEERTGLGGGFDERGKVEYNSHDSDNDEYDDFGRKKKKFREGKSSGKQNLSFSTIFIILQDLCSCKFIHVIDGNLFPF